MHVQSKQISLCFFQGCMSCNPSASEGSNVAAHSPSLPPPDSSTAQDCPKDDISPVSDT